MHPCCSGKHYWTDAADAARCCSGEWRRVLYVGDAREADTVAPEPAAGVRYGYGWQRIEAAGGAVLVPSAGEG